MQIAFVLYPHVTALDLVGPYEVLSGVPGVDSVLVAERPGPVVDDYGREILHATTTFADVPSPDIVVIPGGYGSAGQMLDGELHRWLRAVDGTCTWMTSVCTGALILAASGVLVGRRATTHWLAMDQLPGLGVTPVDERVVIDGHYVSAAGGSAGIDMALDLVGWSVGVEAAQSRQLAIQYAPDPSFDAGSPKTAPAALVTSLFERRVQILSGSSSHAETS